VYVLNYIERNIKRQFIMVFNH